MVFSREHREGKGAKNRVLGTLSLSGEAVGKKSLPRGRGEARRADENQLPEGHGRQHGPSWESVKGQDPKTPQGVAVRAGSGENSGMKLPNLGLEISLRAAPIQTMTPYAIFQPLAGAELAAGLTWDWGLAGWGERVNLGGLPWRGL